MITKGRFIYSFNIIHAMEKTLKERFDKCSWDEYFYRKFHALWRSVQARGGYEIANLFMQERAGNLHLFPCGAEGIGLPTDELSQLIYVPRMVLELDKNSKSKDRENGIAFFSKDDLNQFTDNNLPYPHYHDVTLVDFILYTGSERLRGNSNEYLTSQQVLDKIAHDFLYQQKAMQYSRRLLWHCKRRNDKDLGTDEIRDTTTEIFRPKSSREKVDRFIHELIVLYASEMDLTF